MAIQVSFHLPNSAIFEVTGRHATRYLNNRLSNDITKLSSANPIIRAAALGPQGHLECLFTVILTNAVYTLVSDAGRDSAEFEKALTRYKVTDDVQFKRRDDLVLVHSIGQVSNGLSWSRNRGLAGGVDSLVLTSEIDPTDLMTQTERDVLRLRCGEPQFGIDFDSDVLLPEIGITDAASVTKGCYVGQEVVARIDALGKAPRLLMRGKIAGSAAIDDVSIILQGEKKRTVGEVTKAVQDGDCQICFVLIRNDPQILQSKQLLVDGRQLTVFDCPL